MWSPWWASPPGSDPASYSPCTGPTSIWGPIPACRSVTALKTWSKTQAAEQLAAGPVWSTDLPGLVFTTEDGQPHRVNTYWRALTTAVPGAHPHRLRHSYATHLLEAGTPIHHVAELMGDTVGTVEGTYSHVLRHNHEVVDVARGLLGGVR